MSFLSRPTQESGLPKIQESKGTKKKIYKLEVKAVKEACE